jgi:NAD+ kinase
MTRVGLLGDGAGAAADVVCEGGGDPVVGEDALAGDVDALAALGEPALLDALAADVDAPVLPAAAGREYGGVSRDDLPDALAALTAGEYDVRERQTLSVTTDGVDTRALADVFMVTAEPARISEYAVETGAERVDEVRADGVVAATPAGSHGYARDADGPLLSRGAGALSVVPVAQFRPERSRWVLDPPVTLTVVRDDADVSLLVDGRDNGFADAHQSVTLDWGDPLPVAVVASSTPVATFE